MGAQIRDVRKTKLGMTQRELAQTLGIEQMTVSNWERNIATPRLKTLRQIAAMAEVSVSSFFQDEVAA